MKINNDDLGLGTNHVNNNMDINDDVTCFIMHYLFMDRIEADLQRFVNTWNNHKVSTNQRAVHTPTHNLTPNQMEIQFCIDIQNK
jgi:hypothetical protein